MYLCFLGFPPEECDPPTASLPETVGATARKSKKGVSSQRNPEEREPPTASLPETERATRKSKKGASSQRNARGGMLITTQIQLHKVCICTLP